MIKENKKDKIQVGGTNISGALRARRRVLNCRDFHRVSPQLLSCCQKTGCYDQIALGIHLIHLWPHVITWMVYNGDKCKGLFINDVIISAVFTSDHPCIADLLAVFF